MDSWPDLNKLDIDPGLDDQDFFKNSKPAKLMDSKTVRGVEEPEPALDVRDVVKINQTDIGSAKVNAVDARGLHEFLEVGRDFSTWIKLRIEQYDFVENEDYILIHQNGGIKKKGGDRRSITYFISLEMAKELSMVERNARGKEARKYFLECEKEAKAELTQPMSEVATDNGYPKNDSHPVN